MIAKKAATDFEPVLPAVLFGGCGGGDPALAGRWRSGDFFTAEFIGNGKGVHSDSLNHSTSWRVMSFAWNIENDRLVLSDIKQERRLDAQFPESEGVRFTIYAGHTAYTYRKSGGGTELYGLWVRRDAEHTNSYDLFEDGTGLFSGTGGTRYEFTWTSGERGERFSGGHRQSIRMERAHPENSQTISYTITGEELTTFRGSFLGNRTWTRLGSN